MVMAIILPRQMLPAGPGAHPPLWLYWQPPFAAKAQKLQVNSASHPAKAGKTTWFGEMEKTAE
jgi:hypothetical protein